MALGHPAYGAVGPVITASKTRFREIMRLQGLQQAEWPRLMGERTAAAATAECVDGRRLEEIDSRRSELTRQEQQAADAKQKRERIEQECNAIKRPRKETPEFLRKQKLKEALAAAREEAKVAREKVSEGKRALKRLERGARRNPPAGIVSKNASAVEGLFVRVNNALASAAGAVNRYGRRVGVEPYAAPLDFPRSQAGSNSRHEGGVTLKVTDSRLQEFEQTLLAKLLHAIVAARQRGLIGRSVLIEAVEKMSAEWLLSTEDLSTREAMSAYLSGTSLDVRFSRENRVLANLMAVAMKDSSPDDLRRLVRKKEISFSEIAFGLQGALLGFNGLPKTFTENWYAKENSVAAEQLDDFLWGVVMPAVFGGYAPPARQRSGEEG